MTIEEIEQGEQSLVVPRFRPLTLAGLDIERNPRHFTYKLPGLFVLSSFAALLLGVAFFPRIVVFVMQALALYLLLRFSFIIVFYVATCNDCHTPHSNIVAKYAVKGLNGFRHSYAFTTGNFVEPIRITSMNRDVTEHACLYCHGELTAFIDHAGTGEPTDCLTCHEGVGHGK